jgi:hypothetical protein
MKASGASVRQYGKKPDSAARRVPASFPHSSRRELEAILPRRPERREPPAGDHAEAAATPQDEWSWVALGVVFGLFSVTALPGAQPVAADSFHTRSRGDPRDSLPAPSLSPSRSMWTWGPAFASSTMPAS